MTSTGLAAQALDAAADAILTVNTQGKITSLAGPRGLASPAQLADYALLPFRHHQI